MIFADTGAFLALYLKRDQYHAEAAKVWRTVETLVLTSHHVVDEFATLLGRQAGFSEAANRIQDLYQSPSIDILSSTRDDELDAASLMRKFADQEIKLYRLCFFRHHAAPADPHGVHFRPPFPRCGIPRHWFALD